MDVTQSPAPANGADKDIEKGEEKYLPYEYALAEGAYESEMTSSVPPPCCYKRKIGRMYVCCEDKEKKALLLDGCLLADDFLHMGIGYNFNYRGILSGYPVHGKHSYTGFVRGLLCHDSFDLFNNFVLHRVQ